MNGEMKSDAAAAKESPQVPPEKKVSAAKHERIILHDFDGQCKEVRAQLAEQIKCIVERTEVQVGILSEMEDFVRRRAEAEADHSRTLEKLARGIMQRHKNDRNKRDSWPHHTVCMAWQQLVDDTKAEAEQRSRLATLLTKTIAPSIAARADDLHKMSKKCREIAALAHVEISRVMSELHTAIKTYQIVHTEYASANKKLKSAENEKRKCEESGGKSKGGLSRRQRQASKNYAKRQAKRSEARLRCNKARNEYILCIRAANAALHRFYADDLSALVDCADLGFDFWLQATLGSICESRKELAQREMNALADLETLKHSLDSREDKQKFFESRLNVFMLPKPFEFRPCLGDTECGVSADEPLAAELQQRQRQIDKRLDSLRLESDEVWKSLEECEKQVAQLYSMAADADDHVKWRNDLNETMFYYQKKFEYFLLNGNLMERLQTRSRTLSSALGSGTARESAGGVSLAEFNGRGGRRRAKRPLHIPLTPTTTQQKRPRLFGSSLEEYVEATGEPIPLIVTSTISFLARFALRHQGLLRVSGSTSDINRFREAFENGEDALSEMADGSEANSVAGVLKAYLRELREPPFPLYLFDQLTDCVKELQTDLFIPRVRALLVLLPPSSVRLLRFLFGFLAHLCEFSDENMMEPHNVAICLGPTLLPIPEGKDQVFYHNFVNELVLALIVNWEAIFPSEAELAGPVYDKFAFAREEPVSCAEEDGDEENYDDEGETDGDYGEEDEDASRSCGASASVASAASASVASAASLPHTSHDGNDVSALVARWSAIGGRRSSAASGGGETPRPVWEPLPSGSEPRILSLREQLQLERLISSPPSLPPSTSRLEKKEEGEDTKQTAQPDLVREAERSSATTPLTPLTPSLPPRPLSPHIQELTAMLASLNE